VPFLISSLELYLHVFILCVINLSVVIATGDISSDSCWTHQCNTTLYEECRVVSGRPLCSCRRLCHAVVQPVCASDGRTYDSSCHLRRHGCLTRQPLTVRYLGMCGQFRCKTCCLHCVQINSKPHFCCSTWLIYLVTYYIILLKHFEHILTNLYLKYVCNRILHINTADY